MTEIVYLNGNYIPASEAQISILDRGFLFGDGVYEVIPVYSGIPFKLAGHLERLNRSLLAINMESPLLDNEWNSVLEELIDKNSGNQDAMIYLQLTRGTMPRRDHLYSKDTVPTILAMCIPMEYPIYDDDTQGIKAITVEDNRWQDCHIKSINLLPNILTRQKAFDQGAGESIFIRDGLVIEGSASNIFIVKNDIIRTPPLSRNMLGGITRDTIINLCNSHKIEIMQKPVTEDELHDSDEIWVSNSTQELLPVTTLNQHKVGKGTPGPKWKQLITLYQQDKRAEY